MDEAPSFDLEDQWFISAYRRLNESKPPKLVPGFTPIPISEFAAYYSLFGAPYEIDITLEILQKIDRELFDYSNKVQEARNKSEEKGKKDTPKPAKAKRFGPAG